jgi:AsmA protein
VTAPVGIKRLAIGALAMLFVGLGAAFVLFLLMPAETVREAVKAEIRAVTGFEPVLRGDASVSLFPSARVSFDEVVLDDSSTAGAALSAEHVVARLRFFPLLIGRVAIADISLIRPTITIAFNDDRSSNWSGHVAALSRSLENAPGSAAFSEIRIEDGTIILRDQANERKETLGGVHFSLAWPSISRSFAATGGFSWRGEPMSASISFADFAATLRGERSGLKVRLNGAPFNFAFDGYISYRPTMKMEGTVAADAASLRDMLRWAGQQPPPGGGLARFALKAQANVAGESVGLSKAHLELDGNVGEGVLTFVGRHALQGTLATDSLDLTPYISTVRLLTGGEHGWDNKPITFTGLDGMDVDLRLSAARVTIGSAKLGRTAVAATLRSGQITVAIGESEAFGGVVKGTVGISRSASGAGVRSQMQFAGVDLEHCLAELFGIRRLEGKGNLAFAIESEGASIYELTKRLNGTAELLSRKGAMTGLNVEQLLRRLERRPLSGLGDFRIGKTPYETLTVKLNIINGIAQVEDVRMEGASVGLGLNGSASIPARELDLRGTASLLSTGGGPALPLFELPFMVQGPWNDPIMLPDPESRMQRSGAAAPLLDALRGRAPEAVRSMIDRLTTPTQPAAPAPGAPALAGSSETGAKPQ